MRNQPPVILFWLLAALGTAAPWGLVRWWPDIRPTAPGIANARTCRVNSIYDGDTLRATCSGEKVKVRFHCIDTPEIAQRPWGIESRDYLRRITPKTILLVDKGRDRYGRIVGEVFTAQGQEPPASLNLAMSEAGKGAIDRRYCSDRRFTAAQQRAKSAHIGIWSQPGDHQRPWEYRRKQRAK